MSKLFVIEGTDCSGKETQSKKLIERLKREDIEVAYYSCPNYESPTGKIVAGPYLGKENYGPGIFPEGASNVDPYVASLYYAADRKYNIAKVQELLKSGKHVLLDRYVYSNMAHQGSKKIDEYEKIIDFLEKLEFELLELPRVDFGIFLNMPYEQSLVLKANRLEKLDQHEQDKEHLLNSSKVYFEVAKKYQFEIINCNKGDDVKSIDEINDELYSFVKRKLR